MQAERLCQLAGRGAGAARKTAEEVQLVRSGQSLEGPETGRKRHQRDGGRKLRRGGNRLIDRPRLCLARDRTGLAGKRCRARSSALEMVEHGTFLSVDGPRVGMTARVPKPAESRQARLRGDFRIRTIGYG